MAETSDALIGQLTDPSPRVREIAAHRLSGRPADRAASLPALLERWAGEREPLARASILLAVCRLDLDAGRQLVTKAAKAPDAGVHAAAGLANAWLPGWWPGTQVRWPQRLIDAVVDAFRDGDPLAGGVWTADARGELLRRFPHAGRAPRGMLTLLVHSGS